MNEERHNGTTNILEIDFIKKEIFCEVRLDGYFHPRALIDFSDCVYFE